MFWDLAEPIPSATEHSVFGFIQTDLSKDPVKMILTPEYYAQRMVTSNFSGNTVVPTGVPDQMSVYAAYDPEKASTALLVLNKDTTERKLTFEINDLKSRKISFSPMSVNIITIPDNSGTGYKMVEYTMKMAEAGQPPEIKM